MGQQVSIEGSTDCVIKTPRGEFRGLTIRDPVTRKPMCHRFMNVRYALPTTGDNRWRRPEAIDDSYDYSLYSYKEFGKVCPQPYIAEPKISFLNNTLETSEDCTYLNIWVPGTIDLQKLSTQELQKLPVYFFIHGGWLQYGNANQNSICDPRFLLASEKFQDKFLVVAPAYRLNAFGFLTCQDLLKENPYNANLGFWDQRMALEWTSKYIKYFGGDPSKITVGGLSAGSYSTFFQLAYELYHPEEPQLIKQVFHMSNCLAVQPKFISEVESQYYEFCGLLNIDKDLSGPEKLSKLRSIDASTISKIIPEMKMHTFRAVTDDKFVSSNLLNDIYNGNYAKMLAKRAIRIVIGEVDNEPVLYSYLNTPTTTEDLGIQLENYYPRKIITELLDLYDSNKLKENSPTFKEDLREHFGDIVADSQVYASSRGFLHNITKHGVFSSDNIFRYKVSYVPQCIRKELDNEGVKGVIHGNDLSTWFFSVHNGILPQEQDYISKFIMPFTEFIHLKDCKKHWGSKSLTQLRSFNRDGQVTVEEDQYWDRGIEVADIIYKTQFSSL